MNPDFETAVIAVLQNLSAGEVVSYGEVAEQAGFPRAARAVGNLLRHTTAEVPWWRVVSASGHLRCQDKDRQARLLRSEGVEVADGRIVAASARRRSTSRIG